MLSCSRHVDASSVGWFCLLRFIPNSFSSNKLQKNSIEFF